MPALSIIIVNYNVCHFLEQCLHNVRAAVKDMYAEIWVVDNASTDNSLGFLQPLFPEVKWIANPENEGFARANNRALGLATGEFVLFLNPDTLVPEDCFRKCIAFMQAHPDAGALGIHMIDGSGRYLPESKRGFPGLLTSFFKLMGFCSLFPHSRLFARYYLGHLSPMQNHPVEVLAGAFMLVRRQVLEVTGGFDEQFFMYGEDIDLSYRISKIPHPEGGGCWKNYYFSGSSILHFKGESTRKGGFRYVWIFYKAMLQFVKKHYTPWRANLYSVFIFNAMLFRAFWGWVKGAPKMEDSNRSVWVAGTEADFKTISALWHHSGKKGDLSGRIAESFENTDYGKVIGQWQHRQGKEKPVTLVFCPGPALTLQKIFGIMQPEAKINYMFHYPGSNSMIGSSDSNRSGEVIAGS